MKLRYDLESGALYMRVREGAIEEAVQHADGAYLDTDAKGRVLGVEFLTLKELTEAAEVGGWELPERIEDPDAYEAARAPSLTKMRPARRPA